MNGSGLGGSNAAAIVAGQRPSAVAGVLASLSLCMLLPSLGTSIANVAVPTLARTLDASFQQAQWVVLAYLLATTCLVVGAGRLGDVVGRRRLLVGGLLLFTAASVLCGLAPSLWTLIAARAAQGAGAAVLMALTMAFVGESVPRSHAGQAMGLLGTMSAIGTALGPSLGGLLIDTLGWRAIFLINLPLGLLALGLAWWHLPADHAAPTRRPTIDIAGTLLLALTLAAYALSMTLGRGRFGLLNLGLLLAAVIGVALFGWVETRAASPLIRIAALREPGLRNGLATSALVSTVMMATLVVGPFYLGRALGLGTLFVGLALSIGPMVSAFSGVPAGRLVDRLGTARTVAGALAGMGAGCLALAMAPSSLGVAGYVAPLVVLTASYALFQAANNTAVMADVTPDQRGVISGLLNLARNLGLVTGAAVMGALFASAAGPADLATATPIAVAFGMRTTFAVAAGLMLVAWGLGRGGPRSALPAVAGDA